MSESNSDYGMLSEMPGYSAVVKAVLRNQIRLLVEQLATSTSEECVVLTASVTGGVCTVVDIGSELGKSFLKDHGHIRSQLEEFLLKSHHVKMNQITEHDKRTSGRPVSSFKSNNSFTRRKPYPTKKPSRDINTKLKIKTETGDVDSHLADSPMVVHTDTPGVAMSSRTATGNSIEKMNQITNTAGSGDNANENCSSTVLHVSAVSLESDDSNHTYEEMECSVETNGPEKDVIGHLNISKASDAGLEENEVDNIFPDTAMDMDRNLFADSAKILHDTATIRDRNLVADSDNRVVDFISEFIDGDNDSKVYVDIDLNDMDSVGANKDSEFLQNVQISDCTNNDRKTAFSKKQPVINDRCGKNYSCNLCMRKFDYRCHLKRHICTEERGSSQSLCTSEHSIIPAENPRLSSYNSASQTSTGDVFIDPLQETVTGNDCSSAKTSGSGDEFEGETCEEWEMLKQFIANSVFKNDGQQYITCRKCYKEFLGKRFAEHVLTHTKPYRCTQCGQGFRGRIDRTYHLKKKHNFKEEDDEFETEEDIEAQRVRDIFQSAIARRRLSKPRSIQNTERPKTTKINVENDRGIFSDLPPDSSDDDPEQIDITVGQRTVNRTDGYKNEDKFKRKSTCLKETGKNLDTEEVIIIIKSSQNPGGEGPENYISRIKFKGGIQYVSCKQCGKEFRAKRFSEHLFTHLKPFKCKECGAGFRYKSDRNMHMAEQHNHPSAAFYSDKADFKGDEMRRELKGFLSKYVQSGTDGSQTDTLVDAQPTIETTNYTITDTTSSEHLESTSNESAESPTNGVHVELTDAMNNSNNIIDDTFIIEEVSENSKKRKTFLTCEICGISLTSGHHKEHMRIHSKPFKCKECPYTAARRRTLEMHLFKKHGLSETVDDLFEEL